MSFQYDIKVGNIEAATYDYLWTPRTIRGADKAGIILLHGASTNSQFEFNNVGFASMNKLASILAEEGIPCVGGYMGGNLFGNDTEAGSAGTSFINKAHAYMAAQTGCSATKAGVFGYSMGAGAGLRWAGLNPTKAAFAAGLIPAVSTEHLYTDNPNALLTNGFSQLIASGLGLAYRAVADGVTHGTNILDSATANFQAGDVGKQITRSFNATGGIPVDTTIQSINSTTQAVMDKAATSSASGLAIGIGAPLPMSGDSGFDLIGHFAPILDANDIPNRWYYASDDPYIYTADVVAAAAAAGGIAIDLGAGGHDNDTGNNMAAFNGGSDFSDFVEWVEANGA